MRWMLMTLALGLLTQASLKGQTNWQTIPSQFETVPGNVALSLPARWSKGTLQVILDQELLQPLLGQSITHLRLRKPAFLGEQAYGSRTLDFRVTFSTAPYRAKFISRRPEDNRGSNPIVVFDGPVTLAATPAPAQADAVGADLITLVFDQPYLVGAGNLTIEWQTGTETTTMEVSVDHWIDAVWHAGGTDAGLAVTIGQGGCNTPGSSVIELEMSRGATPGFGQTVSFDLSGAAANAEVLIMLRLVQAESPTLIPGYGGSMAALDLPDCTLWSSILPGDSRTALFSGRGGAGRHNQVILARANALGRLRISADIPDLPELHGQQMTAQALVVDGQSLIASNGLILFLNRTSFQGHAAMIFIPDDFTISIWSPWYGSTPVFDFGY